MTQAENSPAFVRLQSATSIEQVEAGIQQIRREPAPAATG